MAGEPKDQVRLAGNCNDGEQAATICGVGLSAIVDLLLGGTVVVMPMCRAVGMHMNPAVIVRRRGAMIVCGGRGVIVRRRAVIVHGGGAVAFNQAMGDARIIGEREGRRWRENANCVERSHCDRRFDAKAFGQRGQHSSFATPAPTVHSKDRPLTSVCNACFGRCVRKPRRSCSWNRRRYPQCAWT
jgi:hypothetical protein